MWASGCIGPTVPGPWVSTNLRGMRILDAGSRVTAELSEAHAAAATQTNAFKTIRRPLMTSILPDPDEEGRPGAFL
jgi:hypothetical protein